MLSYRHGFHAGNHADVLKHVVLVAALRLLARKDKPLLFVDTHAGAGMYSLEEGFAAKNAEFRSGIGALWSRRDLPALVGDYVELVRAANPDGALRRYPGSPWLALQALRSQDHLRLFELHSTEGRLLAQNFADAGRRVSVSPTDGLAGLKAALPPPSRRGIALIDPSYELGSDYRAVTAALRDSLKRFATGTYVVWYPLLSRREARQLPGELPRAAGTADWLDAELAVRALPADGIGLYGSGMFIVNPPWKLSDEIRALMPWLVRTLGQDEHARHRIDARET